MKLYTVADYQKQFIAAEHKGSFIDLAAAYHALVSAGKADETVLPVFPKTMLGLARCGQAGLRTVERLLQFISKRPVLPMDLQLFFPMDEVKVLAPLPRPGKVIVAGELDEGSWDCRSKFPSTIVGCTETVRLPKIDIKWAAAGVCLAMILGDVPAYSGEPAGEFIFQHLLGRSFMADFLAMPGESEGLLLGNNFPGSTMFARCVLAGEMVRNGASIQVKKSSGGVLTQTLQGEVPARESFVSLLDYISARTLLEPGDVVALQLAFAPPTEGKLSGPYLDIQRNDVLEVQGDGLEPWIISIE